MILHLMWLGFRSFNNSSNWAVVIFFISFADFDIFMLKFISQIKTWKIYSRAPKDFGGSFTSKLSKETKVSEKPSLNSWRNKLRVKFIYHHPKIIRPIYDVYTKYKVHQADLWFLPYDTIGNKNISLHWLLLMLSIDIKKPNHWLLKTAKKSLILRKCTVDNCNIQSYYKLTHGENSWVPYCIWWRNTA